MQGDAVDANDSAVDVARVVTDWYELAGKALGTIRHLATFADEQLVHSVVFFTPDENEQPSREYVRGLFDSLLAARKVVAEGLRRNAEQLMGDLGSLHSFTKEPIWSRFMLAYCELGDFQVGKYSGGRSAWAVLSVLGYEIRRWAVELASLWDTEIVDAANVELVNAFDDKRSACPFSIEIDNAIRQRLVLEESRLIRDLRDDAKAESKSSVGDGDLIDRLILGRENVELTASEFAFLNAYLQQPSNRPAAADLAAPNKGQTLTGRAKDLAKLRLIRDHNINLLATNAAGPSDGRLQPMANDAGGKPDTLAFFQQGEQSEPNELLGKLTYTERLAYLAFRRAEELAGETLTPEQAFNAIREMSDEDSNGYRPVSVNALERADRRARAKRGEQRRELKSGVATRSIERLSDRE